MKPDTESTAMADIPLGTSLQCDPPLQRRAFLGILGGTGLAGAILSKVPGAAREPGEAEPLRLEQATHSTFKPAIGSLFQLEASPGRIVEGRLVEVQELSPAGTGPSQRPPFGLTFCIRGSGYLPQRIYPLRHPLLGELALFLVPIRHEGEDLTMEAVFG